jgi:hypothetical protein
MIRSRTARQATRIGPQLVHWSRNTGLGDTVAGGRRTASDTSVASGRTMDPIAAGKGSGPRSFMMFSPSAEIPLTLRYLRPESVEPGTAHASPALTDEIEPLDMERRRNHVGCCALTLPDPTLSGFLLQDAGDLPTRDAHLMRDSARPGPVGLKRPHPGAVMRFIPP